MITYPIPMVPGPVQVPDDILAAYQTNYGSGDLESDYLELYNQTEYNLQLLLGTENTVVIQTGEGMIALWSALKSCLQSGDRVLSISTGVFGSGIGEMAKSIGAEVRVIDLPYDSTIANWDEIEQAIIEFAPKMITAVHCETPSGTLNPIEKLGKLKDRLGVPLLYVDAVASVGGAPVMADQCHIDLALGGSQKCISAPPNLAFLSVSKRAWDIIEKTNYTGYDALLPYKDAQKNAFFPYTPYWHGMAALNIGAELILKEGLTNSFTRHEKAAAFCRNRLQEIGLETYPNSEAIQSPTVTAVKIPSNTTWKELDTQFRQHGLVVAGSYGPLAGKIFRFGHMGSQANLSLVKQAMDVVEKVIM